MTNVIKITSAPSVPKGPKVPRAYSRSKDGRDKPNTRSMEREEGSVSGDYPLLSEAAMARVEKAGLLLAAGAVVVGSVFLLSKTDNPNPTPANPSGIETSGAESE